MNWRGGLVGLVCCLLMMGLHIGTGEFPHTRPVNGEVGTPGRLYESTVTVNSFTTGQDLYEGRVGLFSGKVGAFRGQRQLTPRQPVGVAGHAAQRLTPHGVRAAKEEGALRKRGAR